MADKSNELDLGNQEDLEAMIQNLISLLEIASKTDVKEYLDKFDFIIDKSIIRPIYLSL